MKPEQNKYLEHKQNQYHNKCESDGSAGNKGKSQIKQ